MNPAFICCKESILNDDNKFVLDFSDEEFVQEVNFLNNLNYYITSLNCNLILKNIVNDPKDNKDRKKLIEELSQKSRLLLKKGAAYQNDIGCMTSAIARYFNFSGFGRHITLFVIRKQSMKILTNTNCTILQKKNQRL